MPGFTAVWHGPHEPSDQKPVTLRLISRFSHLYGACKGPLANVVLGKSDTITRHVPFASLYTLAELYGEQRNVIWKGSPDVKILATDMKIKG